MLIISLSTKMVVKIDTPILSILKLLSSEYDFPQNFIDFFNSKAERITINKLIDIYLIFEHLCFNDLILLLKDEYKNEIDAKIKKELIKKFDSYETKSNKFYSINDLAKALRRLISRYLVGNGDINDIKPERDLCFELSREDLWSEQIKKIDDLDEKIKEHFGEFKLKVDQALNLYELIGNEDKKEIENLI